MPPQEENGAIRSVEIAIEDHGILTLWVNLTFDGSGQAYGGYAHDEHVEGAPRRGRASLADFVLALFHTFEVREWDHLRGKPCRVRRDSTHTISAIGHHYKDRWCSFAEIAARERDCREELDSLKGLLADQGAEHNLSA